MNRRDGVHVNQDPDGLAAQSWWRLAEGVVVMLTLASLIATAFTFMPTAWFAQRVGDVRWLQKEVQTLWPRAPLRP